MEAEPMKEDKQSLQ